MTTAISRKNDKQLQVLSKAVLNLGAELGLSQADLARTLGLSQSSITRMKAGAFDFPESSKVRELALMLVRIYQSLDLILADKESEQSWMHSYNHELSGVPAELILKVEGMVNVVNYLDAYRAGG